MESIPARHDQSAVDLWRLRRNLELTPEERLEHLRRWLQWTVQHRGMVSRAGRGPAESAER